MNCYGAEGFRLGRFLPNLEINERAMGMWSSRDVFSLPACRECPLALVCGGGCARLVVNRGGDLATDVVCPPLAGMPQLQALVDYYLPLILGKRRAMTWRPEERMT